MLPLVSIEIVNVKAPAVVEPSWKHERDTMADQHLPTSWILNTALFEAPVHRKNKDVIVKAPALALSVHVGAAQGGNEVWW